MKFFPAVWLVYFGENQEVFLEAEAPKNNQS